MVHRTSVNTGKINLGYKKITDSTGIDKRTETELAAQEKAKSSEAKNTITVKR
jgi:hypothetical protein